MLRRNPIAIAVLALAPALPAQAADPLSSSFWEVSYLNSTVDFGTPTKDEIEGFRAGVSVGILPYLNFVADSDQRRYQDSRERFSSVGLAGHTLDPAWQAFGAVTYELSKFDDNLSSGGDHSEEGYGVQLGGRAAIENMEFHASYKYMDLGQVTPTVTLTGSRYGAGVVLDLSSWWSLAADYTVRTHTYETTGSSADVEYQEWTVGFRRYIATQADRRNRHGGLLGGE